MICGNANNSVFLSKTAYGYWRANLAAEVVKKAQFSLFHNIYDAEAPCVLGSIYEKEECIASLVENDVDAFYASIWKLFLISERKFDNECIHEKSEEYKYLKSCCKKYHEKITSQNKINLTKAFINCFKKKVQERKSILYKFSKVLFKISEEFFKENEISLAGTLCHLSAEFGFSEAQFYLSYFLKIESENEKSDELKKSNLKSLSEYWELVFKYKIVKGFFAGKNIGVILDDQHAFITCQCAIFNEKIQTNFRLYRGYQFYLSYCYVSGIGVKKNHQMAKLLNSQMKKK